MELLHLCILANADMGGGEAYVLITEKRDEQDTDSVRGPGWRADTLELRRSNCDIKGARSWASTGSGTRG